MKKDKKKNARRDRTFDEGTHPGAYTERYDIDNDKLDFVDSSDDVFIEDDRTGSLQITQVRPPQIRPCRIWRT